MINVIVGLIAICFIILTGVATNWFLFGKNTNCWINIFTAGITVIILVFVILILSYAVGSLILSVMNII